VASCDPTDLNAEEQLRFVSGRRPVFEVAPPAVLERTIEVHYRPESAAENLLRDFGGVASGVQLVEDGELAPLNEDEASVEPVVRLTNLILTEGVKQRASDIHLAPGRSVGTVHVRIDGVLQLRMRIPMPVLHRVISRIKILGSMDIADRLRPQDGRARIRIEDQYYDLRISTVPTRDAEKAVVRVLYSDTAPGIDDLGLSAHDFERFRSMLAHTDSIVLVTGPTGSGKTTTLYAALKELNTGDVNIMTVEDPVEYELAGVTQIQVETKRGVTFASALRAILRQDPDIILLGEIRDHETAEIAVQAAQTGHLVLATLHTNDALGVVARLQDLGLPPASIADSVCGMVAQRLLRTLCPDCSAPVAGELTEDEDVLARRYGILPTRRAVGCNVCDEIGYRGRRPVVETVVSTGKIRQLVLTGTGVDALRKQAAADGMRPLLDAALALVADGVTTLQEVDRTLGETERSTTPEDKVDERTVAPAPSAPTTLAPAKPPDSGPGEPVIDASGAASVLVVDDDPVLRQIAASLLTKEGYAVIQVEDGVAALERLNSLDPADHVDLVISDLDMPRLSGHDLLRLARGSPRTAALPIVVLTGSEDASGEARLIEDGADDYIRKPIDPARFVARVRAVLRRAGG
jgi:type II secretory ATPase GspE/PulE/Tfp pilus assembly ATPase PilB-like protein/CheY-like chemotaxis protein